MKRITLAFIVFLVLSFFVLKAMDGNGDYLAEKRLWGINKKFSEYMKDPQSVPVGTFSELNRQYREFMKEFPNTTLLPMAHMHSGHTFMARKQYDEARKVFEEVIDTYPDNQNIGIQALVEITRTYVLEENEDGVVRSYKRMIREHPLSEIGMKTPLLMAQFYSNLGKKAEADKAMTDAIEHYNALIKAYPGQKTEMQALRLQASCYVAKRDFSQAVDVLGAVLLKFPDPKFMNLKQADDIVRSINTISLTQSQDYEKPIKIYSEFVKKYPTHPFSKTFRGLIEKFQVLLDEKVGIILEKK